MARDARMEARLQRWAQGVTVGDGSGYPAMCVIHPQWQPPSPGTAPTLKVAHHSDVRETHRAIGALSMRLANTLVVHYCLRLPMDEQAQRLGCEVRTVHGRVEEAHRRLQGILAGMNSCNKHSVG